MEGLGKFREAFEAYSDNYVIIGGTACVTHQVQTLAVGGNPNVATLVLVDVEDMVTTQRIGVAVVMGKTPHAMGIQQIQALSTSTYP